MRIDTKNLAELVLGTVVDGASIIARNAGRRLRQLTGTGQTEDVRCRGTTQSGTQCRRSSVSGSAYCHQHRIQAKSDGRLLIVIGALDKAASIKSNLSRKSGRDPFIATTPLATVGPKPQTQGLIGGWNLRLRQFAERTLESIKSRRRWQIILIVLLLLAAVPIALQVATGGGLNSLAGLARGIVSGNLSAVERDPNVFGRQQSPTDEANAAGLFTLEDNRTPGTDFSGAYVFGLEHLSANSSMLQIFVPAGVEGPYLAIVSASEGFEYKCVILHHYTDRLHCIGPSLPEASQVNLQIFKIDEADGSQILVFETNYTTGEFTPLPAPTPAFPVYGGAFIWPDRFDRVEILKEQQSSWILSPLSALLGILLLLVYRILSQREDRLNRRLVQIREISSLH